MVLVWIVHLLKLVTEHTHRSGSTWFWRRMLAMWSFFCWCVISLYQVSCKKYSFAELWQMIILVKNVKQQLMFSTSDRVLFQCSFQGTQFLFLCISCWYKLTWFLNQDLQWFLWLSVCYYGFAYDMLNALLLFKRRLTQLGFFQKRNLGCVSRRQRFCELLQASFDLIQEFSFGRIQ